MTSPVLGYSSAGPVRVDVDRLVSSRALVTANSGAGKSYALRRLIEQTNGRIQQLVLDPEGEFHTLREKFDLVLAGRGGDCPAEPRSAALLARRLLELRVSAVIDLYELAPRDRIRFVRLFLEALIDAPRELWHPALVIVDEAHAFAPEKGHGEAESVEAVARLMAQGRKRGFAGVLATQRLSKLAKDVAAEANNLLIGRAALDVDLRRAGDALGLAKADWPRLRSLEPGHFFAFGPALSDEVVELHVGPVETSHPRPGQKAGPTPPPREKVRAVLAQLSDLPKEAEAEAATAAELRGRVKALERELAAAKRTQPSPPPPKVEIRERQVFRAGEVERFEKAVERFATTGGELAKIGGAMAGQVAAAHTLQRAASGVESATRAVAAARRAVDVAERRATVEVSRPPARSRKENSPPAEGLARPHQAILDSLAWLESIGVESPIKPLVALLADQTPTSSGYRNLLGFLRARDLVCYPQPGALQLTEAGREISRAPAVEPTAEAVQERVLSKLAAPAARILRTLLDSYPEALPKEDLAVRAGQVPTSSGYRNLLGHLRSRGLIDYPKPGTAGALPILFLEGSD